MRDQFWLPEFGALVISVIGGVVLLLLIAAGWLMRETPEDQ